MVVADQTTGELWGRFWIAVAVQYALLVVLVVIAAVGIQTAEADGFVLAVLLGGPAVIAATFFAWRAAGRLAFIVLSGGFEARVWSLAVVLFTTVVAFLPLLLTGWLAIADGDAAIGIPCLCVPLGFASWRIARLLHSTRTGAAGI